VGKTLTEYNNKSMLEVLVTTALSNALLELDPLKNNYSNRYLPLEISILQWMLEIVPKLSNNLNLLKEVVMNEIDDFKVKYDYAKNINDIDNIDKSSKSIEILQICLFLITIELEFNHLYSVKGYNKK
jgi:hypothetical protein